MEHVDVLVVDGLGREQHDRAPSVGEEDVAGEVAAGLLDGCEVAARLVQRLSVGIPTASIAKVVG